ncbi:MAG: phosphoribosylamine--glycine ligase [Opitutales bacterium]|nr:phosphoribosylamine--glycine ligase [Opitutales bacterium]
MLILGSGGREHALYIACKASLRVQRAVVAPGNGGIPPEDCREIDPCDALAVEALAAEVGAGLVIIGPEAPLAAGVADSLRAAGYLVYGPGKQGAELEASKAVCKAFFARHGIPTAAYAGFADAGMAEAHLETLPEGPVVVKASGLAAGKGVYVCADLASARAAVREIMVERVFGESGDEVIIEECLMGEEASIMVLVSGDTYTCLPASQDHKRIGEGDTGPNTGGMGAYAPAGIIDPALQQRIGTEVIEPTLRGFKKEGIDFRGTLFIGLMITEEGPKVLEFNVRFGDPECQVLLPLVDGDPVDLLLRCARGEPLPKTIPLRPLTQVIVVLAAEGYPGNYRKDVPITLPDSLPPATHIVHAGTRLDTAGQLRSSGGRVLGVVAGGPDIHTALQRAYAACDAIEMPGKTLRRDIGWREIGRNPRLA